jgi:polar amino acid transport system permease protein
MLASFSTHLFWQALSSGPFWRGALLAIELTLVAFAAAIVIGFFLALGRSSKRRAVRGGVFVYTWIFRATPTLLQLLFVWDALPQIWGVFREGWFTPFMAASVALALNEAAYMAEIVRSGLISVDPGQELAGRALGMSRRRILQRVIVPQAVRIVIPPMGNEFITLLKLTSLATVISVTELLTASQNFYSTNFSYEEAFAAAALYYLFIVSILMFFQSRLEKRFTFTSARRRVRDAPAVPAALSHDAR